MPFNPMDLIQGSGSSSMSVIETNSVNPYSLRYNEKSFFLETLDFLSEMNLEYYEANRKFYAVMAESAGCDVDVRVIHEGFSDFFDKIKKIIEKFLNFIKSLFMRFLTMINSLIGRDKYILNHKEEFDKFSSIHEFDISGFVFTINNAIPVIETQAAFNDNFVFDLADTVDSNRLDLHTRIGNDGVKRLDAIKQASKDLTINLENDSWYDKFRATVLNSDVPIAKDDFADKLFTEFRNGESIAEDITITNYEVMSALRRFKDAKSDIDKAKKLKAKIDSEYDRVKKTVEKMVNINRVNGTNTTLTADGVNGTDGVALNNDEIMAMDTFTKAKAAQIQEMSNIHAIAFAAKLDAMTDSYKQDKNVLFKALSRVQSTKKEV